MEILILSLVALAFGIFYHGRGGAFISFGNSSDVGLFGIDSTGEPYINYGGTQAARFFWWVIPVTLTTYYVLDRQTYMLQLTHFSSLHLALIFFSYALLLFVGLLVLNHGPYQNFGTVASSGKSTFLTFWLPQYTMSDPQWYRELIDTAGLTIVGFGRGVIQCLPLLFLDLHFLWLIPFSGLMGIAYAMGYGLFPNGFGFKFFNNPDDISEFLTGVFYGLGLAAALLF